MLDHPFPPPDKNTATVSQDPDAAPLTGFGERRADLSKAAYPVKKKLGEKKKSSKPLKMEVLRGFRSEVSG